jgi:hypothetical protein
LIFYYIVMIRLFGEGYVAAMVGGLVIGVLGACGVAGAYALLRRFKLSEDAAFYGASYFALTPSLVGFLPQFDQAYVLLACILLMLWVGAVERRSRVLAVAFGLWLAFLLFLTPTFLMLGAFCGLFTLLSIRDRGLPGLIRAIDLSACAVFAAVALFLILWFTGLLLGQGDETVVALATLDEHVDAIARLDGERTLRVDELVLGDDPFALATDVHDHGVAVDLDDDAGNDLPFTAKARRCRGCARLEHRGEAGRVRVGGGSHLGLGHGSNEWLRSFSRSGKPRART